MERPIVAIISDDAAFANALTRRWLAERGTPAFVLMQSDSDFHRRSARGHYQRADVVEGEVDGA